MAEGISIFTHKLGEGTGGIDNEAAQAFASFRSAGAPVIGPYWVVRSGSVGPQVDALISAMNAKIPGWKDLDNFFIQTDLERWDYDNVPASTGISFSNLAAQATGKTVALYASHGQYGGQLSTWKGMLWNADYVGGTAGFKALYPGDNWKPDHGSWNGGWTSYSGQEPDLLQYTSKATIAGKTTCDASAFRGTLDQFKALIGGDMADLTEDNLNDIADRVWARAQIANPPNYSNPGTKIPPSQSLASIMQYNYEDDVNGRATKADVDDIQAKQAAMQADIDAQSAKLDQILAALNTPSSGVTVGGDVEVTGTLHVTAPTA